MDVEIIKTAGGYLIATFFTTVGLGTIINSVVRSKNFGVTARPEDKAILAFIKSMGARDLYLGVITGMFMLKGDQRNAVMASIAPAMDAWSVWTCNGRLKEAWSHIIGGSVVGALGLWLID